MLKYFIFVLTFYINFSLKYTLYNIRPEFHELTLTDAITNINQKFANTVVVSTVFKDV